MIATGQPPASGSEFLGDRSDGPIVLFDGVCNFCNGGINFLLRHDRAGTLRFAAMQSDAGQRLLRHHGLPPNDFQSFVVIDGNRLLFRSAAVLFLAEHLGQPWRTARILAIIPVRLRDGCYNLIARNRYRLLGKRSSCRVPTVEEQERFLV